MFDSPLQWGNALIAQTSHIYVMIFVLEVLEVY